MTTPSLLPPMGREMGRRDKIFDYAAIIRKVPGFLTIHIPHTFCRFKQLALMPLLFQAVGKAVCCCPPQNVSSGMHVAEAYCTAMRGKIL